MDRHTTSSSTIPAPYGQACIECSQSKCKCIIRSIDACCERCHRMKKECRPAVSVRRRNPTPKKRPVPQSKRLEEKLDGLVSLLKSGTSSNTISAIHDPTHHTSIEINDDTSLHNNNGRSVTQVLDDSLPALPVLTPGTSDTEGTTSNDSPASLPHDVVEPSPAEANVYLTMFRCHKSNYFPFVYIPLTTTAQQLRQDRPFLWLCIMTIASPSTSQQQVLGSKIRDIIAQELILKSGQSIDLLLGLLAYIGWSNYQVHSKCSLSVFTQLATSLVFDLGLNKPLPRDGQISLCISPHKHTKTPTVRTLEERRAVLGCFLITSIISSFLQKIDALRWSPYMNECLQVLDESKECLSDEILVQQVRLQLIVEKVTLGVLDNSAMETAKQPSLSFYLQALHSQIQEIKNTVPSQLQHNEVFLTHLYSTELMVNEIALSQVSIVTNYPNFQQLKCLYACVESIRSWFEVFFTISPTAYIGFPFSIFSQLLHCLVTLYRLSTLDDPAWDKDGVQKTANILLVLNQVIKNLEQVATLAELDNTASDDEDIFSRTAKKLGSIRLEWEAKLRPDDLLVSTISNPPNANEMFPAEALALTYEDNDWVMDYLLDPKS